MKFKLRLLTGFASQKIKVGDEVFIVDSSFGQKRTLPEILNLSGKKPTIEQFKIIINELEGKKQLREGGQTAIEYEGHIEVEFDEMSKVLLPKKESKVSKK